MVTFCTGLSHFGGSGGGHSGDSITVSSTPLLLVTPLLSIRQRRRKRRAQPQNKKHKNQTIFFSAAALPPIEKNIEEPTEEPDCRRTVRKLSLRRNRSEIHNDSEEEEKVKHSIRKARAKRIRKKSCHEKRLNRVKKTEREEDKVQVDHGHHSHNHH